MNINFSKNETTEKWESTFSCNSDFVLHIERENQGFIQVLQTSVSDSQYATIKEFPNGFSTLTVFDVIITSPVWPLYFKVILDEEPDMAIVTES